MNNNGFEISVKDGGIFLLVSEEADVSVSDVAAVLKKKHIEDYSGQEIMNAIQSSRGKEVKIAERKPELDTGAKLSIRIADNNLDCSIHIAPPIGGKWPTASELKNYVLEHGVTEGIKENVIEDVIRNKVGDTWCVVAEGVAPTHGKDANIVFKIDITGHKPKDQGDDKKIDLRELGSVVNVLKGQELAVKVPLVPGVDGIDVKGRSIKATQGKDKNMPGGSNTVTSEDGLTLIADTDGHVTVKDNKIHVSPIFEVNGDVDYSVGNVQFVGPVHIKGAVREGFEVSASGDLFVDGVVEGAALSCDGTMNVKIGVRGTGKANLQAKQDINCGYIDQARVRAGGDVFVNEAILHSDVGARGRILAMGSKKGQIVGGKVQAGQEVVCDTLGSEMGTKTEVVVGIFPELMEERKNLQNSQKEMQSKSKEVETNLGYIKKLEEAGQLDAAKRELMVRLTKAKFQLQAQLAMVGTKLQAMEEDIERCKLTGKVRVRNKCNSGVIVQIRGITYIVRETLHYTSFYIADGEIKLGSFE